MGLFFQGGQGWVSSLGRFSTLHLKILVSRRFRGSVKLFSTNKSILKNSKQAGAGGEIIYLLTGVTLLLLSL